MKKSLQILIFGIAVIIFLHKPVPVNSQTTPPSDTPVLIPQSTPTLDPAKLSKLEQRCVQQPIDEPRTYTFREIPEAAYGPQSRFDRFMRKVKHIVPFWSYDASYYFPKKEITFLRETYGRNVPRGETKRSKQFRLKNETRLREMQEQAEKRWLEWTKANPGSDDKEKIKAENQIRNLGLNLTRMSKFDWREQGLDVGEVGSQGTCNTCWAFASLDAAESSRRLNLMRTSNKTLGSSLRPSVQQLIDCIAPKDEFCAFNWHGTAFSFLVDKGIPLGGTTDYRKEHSGCDAKQFVKASTWDYVHFPPYDVPPVEKLKTALVIYGPVVATLKFDECLYLYGGGVFNEKINETGNHMVLILGWDDEKSAWLIKNSFGIGWGEEGFGWVKYDSNNIGQFAAWIETGT